MRISQAFTISLALFSAGASMAASPGENKQVVADYYAAYASGDMNRVAGFLPMISNGTFPAIIHLPGTKRGRNEVAAFFRELGKSGFRAELIALMADENWVVDMHRGLVQPRRRGQCRYDLGARLPH